MTNNPTDNERNTVVYHDNDAQDILKDLDNNTWVVPDDMQNLPLVETIQFGQFLNC